MAYPDSVRDNGEISPRTCVHTSMAFYLCVICIVIHVVVSILRLQPETADLDKLCWKSPLEPLRGKGWPGLANYKVVSCCLAGVMGVLYYVFA